MLKILLIGCGLRGNSWARAVNEDPTCEITAYVDINQEAIDSIRKKYGDEDATGFLSLSDALEKSNAEAAILATPPQYHFDQSVKIMNKGLHLLAEKPLTEAYETSLKLVEIADEKNLNLIVGMQFRYMPVTQAYRNIFSEGRFGVPSFSQFAYIRTRNPMNYGGLVLNQYCNDMAHTFLLEQAIHHLDLIRFVYSTDVESVQAYEWNPIEWKRNPYRQDPNVSALITLKNGMHINYLGTWISGNEGINTGIDFRWRTDFEKGIVIQPDLFGEGGLYTASRDDNKLKHIDTGPIEPFHTDTKLLLVEFYECCKKNKTPDTSGRDHLQTLVTVLACIESSVTGKKIVIEDYHNKLLQIKK